MTATAETRSAVLESRGRVPDFFIVGHAKCGTTALYEMLRAHPGIFMPDLKEPMFFARNPAGPGVGPIFEQTGRRRETLEDYISLFASAKAEQRVGEASTFYLFSRSAPARIAELQPRAKIIAILREPASFLRSLHLQALQNRTETVRDLRAALALEDERREGRSIPVGAHWPAALIYTDRVRYVEQLERYREAFSPEQLLVLIYDDFRSENEVTVRRVLRFLEVDDSVPLEVVRANPTVAVRSPAGEAVVRSLRTGGGPLAGAARATGRGLTSARVRREVLYPMQRRLLYGGAPAADEELMRELRRRFRGEVIALGEHLERDLVKLWGYEDVD